MNENITSFPALPLPTATQFREMGAAYLAMGLCIIPDQPPKDGDKNSGKKPLLPDWPNARLTVDDLVKYWPDSAPAVPNIGILTGEPSRMVVLDLDDPALGQWFLTNHPEAADTMRVSRNNAEEGRCHLYFALPEGMQAPVSAKGAGWDFQSTGRQVVAPPSVHYSSGQYQLGEGGVILPWNPAYLKMLPPLRTAAKTGRTALHVEIAQPFASRPMSVPMPVLELVMSGAPQGERNDRAFWLACQLRDTGLTQEQAIQYMEGFAKNCHPPMESCELPGIMASAFSRVPRNTGIMRMITAIRLDPKMVRAEKVDRICSAVLTWLGENGRFYYHAELRDHATCMFFDAMAKELLLIGSDRFRSWLADSIDINRADNLFTAVMSKVQDEALVGKGTKGVIPERYWTSRQGAIYLSNGPGRMAKITKDGVEIVDNGTDEVIFSVSATLRPWDLVEPKDPFLACSLFSGARFVDDHGLDLSRIWAMMMPSNIKCKPQLATIGAVGSGKTRVQSGIADLYGIPCRIMKVDDGSSGESDFWTAINSGGLTIVDNVDKNIRWLADNLAAASTGGTKDKRRLYTDSGLEQQRALAWVGVTSANPTFAADAGAADRFLVVRMERRTETTSESALMEEITRARDAGLSFIAQAWHRALGDTQPVPENLNKRHPEFAELAIKLGRAIGREVQVKDALQKAELDKARFNLENSELGAALLAVIEPESPFRGSARDLLSQRLNPNSHCMEKYWTPKKVGKQLQLQVPHLKEVFVFKQSKGHAGEIIYDIAKRPSVPVHGVAAVPTPSAPIELSRVAPAPEKDETPPVSAGLVIPHVPPSCPPPLPKVETMAEKMARLKEQFRKK